MKKKLFIILLLALVLYGCDLSGDTHLQRPSLPPTVFGQLPTRSAIIQAAEAVGAANVEITAYGRAAGALRRSGGIYITINGVRTRSYSYYYVFADTNGGYRPNWWREDQRWNNGGFPPTLVGLSVVYDATGRMHQNWTVREAIYQLFRNAGFWDATWHRATLDVRTTTDNNSRIIQLPTHASIINVVEQLGTNNVTVDLFVVPNISFYGPRYINVPFSPHTLFNWIEVPADRNFYTVKRNAGILLLSYEHQGLGAIVTNADVVAAIRALFRQYGFERTDVRATNTLISAGFPLPSFDLIRQAAEQAGANNVLVSTYLANNEDVIPMNEGNRLANTPIIIEINYDGPIISAVYTNVRALFANFNTVHIGNNAIAAIPLPRDRDIWIAVIAPSVLFIPATSGRPCVYTVNGVPTWGMEKVAWNARIRIVMHSGGSIQPTVATAALARQTIINMFNEQGFFNLDVTVNR